jgi:hypothetical protein
LYSTPKGDRQQWLKRGSLAGVILWLEACAIKATWQQEWIVDWRLKN